MKYLNSKIDNLNDKQNSENFLNETETRVKIDMFDISKPLEPHIIYNPIECRKSATIQGVSAELCFYNKTYDVYVSGSIRTSGIWEAQVIESFMKSLIDCVDCLIFDIGANIGQYSLFAAKLGRKVISVEPFYDNILRIHKAASLENISNKITLVRNAISKERGKIMLLAKNETNIGGQSLMNFKDKKFTEDDFKNSEYGHHLVKTILTDDLVNILPLKDSNEPYKKAIMKIDIEGFEPYAFKSASGLFHKLEFIAIFMEFMHFANSVEQHEDVQSMINFLYDHDFQAYNNDEILNRTTWKSNWPVDIIWRKQRN